MSAVFGFAKLSLQAKSVMKKETIEKLFLQERTSQTQLRLVSKRQYWLRQQTVIEYWVIWIVR